MSMDEKRKLLLTDTQVPDLFISDYMLGLSACAIKCYLYYLMVEKKSKNLSEKDFAGRLGFPLEEIKGALAELTMAGLIQWNNKGKIELMDIKEVEVEAFLRLKNKSMTEKPEGIRPEDNKRDDLAHSVEKTFFHGSMAHGWYREMDILWDEFQFEPDVIYHLFKYCKEKRHLSSIQMVHTTAVLWKQKGVKSMKELSDFLEKESAVSQMMIKIRKKLRRRMTEYDEEYIRDWMEKLPFSEEIMEFAIRRMSEFQNYPSLKGADELLKEWHLRDLKTFQEIELFEKEKAAQNKKQYAIEKKTERFTGQKEKKENFEPVVYDEDFLKGLEVDLEQYR